MKSLKRMLAVVLAVVMMMGLGVTSMAAEDGSKEYLSALCIENDLTYDHYINLQAADLKGKREFVCVLPTGKLSIGLGANLSEAAPTGSKIKIKYHYVLNGATISVDEKVTPNHDNSINSCSGVINSNESGEGVITVEAGVDDDVEVYKLYLQREGSEVSKLTENIKSLPEVSEITLDNKVNIEDISKSYNELSDWEKECIPSECINKLTDSETKIAELTKAEEDSKKAAEVTAKLEALPEVTALTLADKDAVAEARAAYDELTDAQKELITPSLVQKLTDSEAKIVELTKAEEDKKQETPTTEAKPATKPSKTVAVKKGTTFTVKGYKYKVTSNLVKNPTVTVVGYKNKKLTKVNVASTVNYKKVNFKVTAIGNKAFKNQKKAKSVVIGKNVKTIGTRAFAGDSKVKKITVKSTVLDKVGSKAFSGIDKKAVIKVPAKQLKSYKKMMKNKGQKKTVKIAK